MDIIIQCDSREQENKEVLAYFDKIGQKYFVSKVYSGDYMNFCRPKVVIDLKASLLELAGNLTRQHDRFVREIKRASETNCNFVVLIREPLKSIDEVKNWKSPHSKVKGETLYKTMITMANKYGVYWGFCTRTGAGEKILKTIKYFDKMEK